MASERLRGWAERVRGGDDGASAARAVGFAEVTATHHVGRLRAQAIAEGLLPDPAVDRRAVADHEAVIEAFVAQLGARLPTAGALFIDVMEGKGVGTDGDGNVIPMPPDQYRALLEFMNRVVGRPAIHIHGHKDQAELDAERELTVRIVRGNG